VTLKSGFNLGHVPYWSESTVKLIPKEKMSRAHRQDDLRSLKVKIDEKAYDLFKAKEGVPPFRVTRVFKGTPTDEITRKKSSAGFVDDQNVWSSADLGHLADVISFLSPAAFIEDED